jgi:hypothetical protein
VSDSAERQEITRRRVRFVLPARDDGLAIGDFQAAVRQAYDDRERRGLSNDYYDALRVIVEDSEGGEVVLFFDVEEPATPAPEPFAVMPCLHESEHDVLILWPPENEKSVNSIRVLARCCSREQCRTRLMRQISDIVGHRPKMVPLADG